MSYEVEMSPCLLKIKNLNEKQTEDTKPKLISISDLLQIISQELKYEQQSIIALVESYLQIHEMILKKIINQTHRRSFSKELEEHIRYNYNFKHSFKKDY